MVAKAKIEALSHEAFVQIAMSPENRERRLELVDGEIIEVVSSDVSSAIGALMLVKIGSFVIEHQLGYMTDAQGGYRVGADDLIPDCAFVSKARQAKPKGESYATVIPDLVVEVKSPGDSHRGLIAKALKYLDAGVPVVLLVLPDQRRVALFTQTEIVTLTDGDVITLREVLPGFALAVSDIFAGLA